MATSVKPPMTQVPGTGREPERAWEGQGWWIFAGVVLLAAGVMRLFDSIWAFSYQGTLPANLEDALFGTSLNTYGWVYLGVAVVLFGTGIAVFMGAPAGRWIGVAAGAIGTITAIWWMPYYPVWSLTYVALGVLVIYALAAHGKPRELEAA